MSLRVASPLAVTDEAIFSDISCHCESRRQADEAIVSDRGSIIIPLPEKIASWSSTTRNDTKYLKRLLRGL
ncbi:MAG: hypothetical protein FWG80_03730 [Alphaproteobacteria bacterium]|nr:hypothetical protein [Alphaproteobacteria bacterium]